MTISVFVVDDHELFRTAVLAMLRDEPGVEVVGQAGDGLEAAQLVAARNPDVVLMDVSMRGMNGIEATRLILGKRPDTRIVALSMHGEKRFVSAMLEAGASGYLIKDCSLQELYRALGAVMAGETYLSPAVAGVVFDDYRARLARDAGSPLGGATSREREVLQLLAEGHTTTEIGKRLHVSGKTVGTHRQSLMKKLGIRSIAGLTKYAIREGITSSAADDPI